MQFQDIIIKFFNMEKEVLNSSDNSGSPRGTKMVRVSGSSSFGMILVSVLLAVFGSLWYYENRIDGNEKEWQAVFLTNGQVYFGKVVKHNKVEMKIKEIYYLQVTQPLQQSDQGGDQASKQGELSLVKLGNELHGPTDSMTINRDQILFIEDLKDDSKVVQAIANHKSGL